MGLAVPLSPFPQLLVLLHGRSAFFDQVMRQLLMVPSAVQWFETDTPTAPWYALPCLGDDLRVHARYYHMNVRVCHPLGFYHHHCLVLDPALTAGFPQVGQKSGLVRQYLRESGVLGVVVQDGVEVPEGYLAETTAGEQYITLQSGVITSGSVTLSATAVVPGPDGNTEKNTITLGIGPAGTGKTYLAVAAAVAAFRAKEVNRIILTRPAVEAGERLGFLPGDLQSKVDPYLRPLYDALFDMLGAETYNKYLERGNIEVAPLAYMRGRTLDDSFIILDEAQNTSREQMKMFLTRLGFGSKIVITGDITQIDLPGDKPSGLKDAMKILKGVEGVSICQLTQQDVVRHVMVQRIIEAYARFEEKRK